MSLLLPHNCHVTMTRRTWVIVSGLALALLVFVGYSMFVDSQLITNSSISITTKHNPLRLQVSGVAAESVETNNIQSDSTARTSASNNVHSGDFHDTNPKDVRSPELETVKSPVQMEPWNWTPPTVPEEVAHVDQTDLQLAKHIRDTWILHPFTGPRNLALPYKVHYSQREQSQYIDDLLKQRTNGFYIECGAGSGENLSNSLFFEKSRNWTGILIEGNPDNFREILLRRRHSYMLNACLSPGRNPEVLDFRMADVIGGLVDHMESGHRARVIDEKGEASPVKVQCFPLLAILRALNVTHVDYFSLDIEGAEYEILKDFPFDEIKVDVLTIEYVVSRDIQATGEKLKKITDLMIRKYGYKKTSYQGNEDIMLSIHV